MPALTQQALDEILQAYPAIQSAIYSSVGREASDTTRVLATRIADLHIVGSETRVPLSVAYDRSTLGSDRLAAVVGAYSLAPCHEILVLDAGTAITYERISASGTYLGGNISPGLYVRLKAMHSYTCRLPQIDDIEIEGGFGVDTASAMARGAALGLAYEIDGYIRALKAEYPDARIYMTGGDADGITELMSHDVEIVPDLVLLGLNQILEYNKRC